MRADLCRAFLSLMTTNMYLEGVLFSALPTDFSGVLAARQVGSNIGCYRGRHGLCFTPRRFHRRGRAGQESSHSSVCVLEFQPAKLRVSEKGAPATRPHGLLFPGPLPPKRGAPPGPQPLQGPLLLSPARPRPEGGYGCYRPSRGCRTIQLLTAVHTFKQQENVCVTL